MRPPIYPSLRPHAVVHNWGRIGTDGRELVEEFVGEIEAGQALRAMAQAKWRRGYRDL